MVKAGGLLACNSVKLRSRKFELEKFFSVVFKTKAVMAVNISALVC